MSWRHFELSEFACNCCGGNETKSELIDLLDEGREVCGFPFVVRSGYRCPAHNHRVSTTGTNGPHTTGLAVDLGVHGAQAWAVLAWAMSTGRFGGIGVNQKGDWQRRFIHLDLLEHPERFRPTVWSY